MKHLLPLTFLMSAVAVNAQGITAEQALRVAEDFCSSKNVLNGKMKMGGRESRTTLTAVPMASTPGIHAFNVSETGGFVIVGSDGNSPVILGYSDKGSFDSTSLPPQLKGLLEVGVKTTAKPNHLRAAADKELLYPTAEWGQGEPYNTLCPEIEGVQAPAGCVATAMAIAMQYHNWPDYTDGGVEKVFYSPNPTFDFSDYTIDWGVLADKNNSGFAEEAARLTYSAGVAAQMIYGAVESAAEVWPIGHRMVELYSYAAGCQYVERERYSEEEWNALLRSQLEEFGPVIYRGGSATGHCFVIDGYDTDGLYHVNWGWDGSLNGYFALDFSDVGGMSFGDYQGMVINLIPDREHKQYSKAFIPNVDEYLGVNGWNFMNPDIIPGEEMTFKMPDICLNGFSGHISIGVVDKDDNILDILEYVRGVYGDRERCPFPGVTPEQTLIFPELKEGERFQIVAYESGMNSLPDGSLIIADTSYDIADWKIVTGSLRYPSSFSLTGNRSELADVRFHVDKNLPAFFTKNKVFATRENEFTVKGLLGSDFPDNVIGPKGMTVDMKSFDKDGNPQEPLYVSFMDEDTNMLQFTLSLYHPRYDIYIGYDGVGDTRKDSELDTALVIEEDGLVYHLEDNTAKLIGYDEKTLPETVKIPVSVVSGGKEYPVMDFGAEALMFAPARDLVIQANSGYMPGYLCFAGMKNLRSISLEGENFDTPVYALWADYPFQGSEFKEAYFDNFPSDYVLNKILGVDASMMKTGVEKTEMDFYVSAVSTNGDWYTPIFNIENIYSHSNEALRISYNLPGLGMENPMEGWPEASFPVNFMWNYCLDLAHNLVEISDVAENVAIDEVLINGIKAHLNDDGIYTHLSYGMELEPEMEVTVNYTVNGHKKLSTIYSREHNEFVGNYCLTDVREIAGIAPRLRDVYSLQGIRILSKATSDQISGLAPGVYIIDGRKRVIK